MITLGLRCSPTDIVFAIYDSDKESLDNIEQISISKALTFPQKLQSIRTEILVIIEKYQVTNVGIKAAEGFRGKINIERIQIEGVVLASLAEANVSGYIYGNIATLASKASIPRGDFKKYISGEKEFSIATNWGALKEKEREAVITAIGAKNA